MEHRAQGMGKGRSGVEGVRDVEGVMGVEKGISDIRFQI